MQAMMAYMKWLLNTPKEHKVDIKNAGSRYLIDTDLYAALNLSETCGYGDNGKGSRQSR